MRFQEAVSCQLLVGGRGFTLNKEGGWGGACGMSMFSCSLAASLIFSGV